MPLQVNGLGERTGEAVQRFWENRADAAQAQQTRGAADQGGRAAVTAGRHLDGFAELAAAIVVENGLPEDSIGLGRQAQTLPGFFRPAKVWDLLVVHRGALVAALEFKSQVGPSFGNNFNNRAEEAIGSACDLQTAFREGALGQHPKPFVGWLALVEDCEESRRPAEPPGCGFPLLPEFRDTSYIQRYDLLCQKLVAENLYTATCLLTSPRQGGLRGAYAEASRMTGIHAFAAQLAGHAAAIAAMEG